MDAGPITIHGGAAASATSSLPPALPILSPMPGYSFELHTARFEFYCYYYLKVWVQKWMLLMVELEVVLWVQHIQLVAHKTWKRDGYTIQKQGRRKLMKILFNKRCIAELGSVWVCAIFDGGNSKPKINCNEGAKGTLLGPPLSLTNSQWESVEFLTIIVFNLYMKKKVSNS